MFPEFGTLAVKKLCPFNRLKSEKSIPKFRLPELTGNEPEI